MTAPPTTQKNSGRSETAIQRCRRPVLLERSYECLTSVGPQEANASGQFSLQSIEILNRENGGSDWSKPVCVLFIDYDRELAQDALTSMRILAKTQKSKFVELASRYTRDNHGNSRI